MPRFYKESTKALVTCHVSIQKLLRAAIKNGPDFSVLEGFRDRERQELLFRQGMTTKHWPNSRHNRKPSMAVDIGPYRKKKPHIDWNDTKSFHVLAGYVMGIASQMGLKIRWGGDWNSNWNYKDQKFHDLPHLELRLTPRR